MAALETVGIPARPLKVGGRDAAILATPLVLVTSPRDTSLFDSSALWSSP